MIMLFTLHLLIHLRRPLHPLLPFYCLLSSDFYAQSFQRL